VSEVEFLVGRPVSEVRDTSRIVFVDGGGDVPSLYADVGECVCSNVNGEPLAVPHLAGRTVSATSTEAGTLGISFADGATLRCDPDENYEAWEVVGGDPQYLVVCMPGGELAVWDSSHIPSAAEAQEVAVRVAGPGARVREVTARGSIIVEPGVQIVEPGVQDASAEGDDA
jgi:Family of unknown function (DUF6188)